MISDLLARRPRRRPAGSPAGAEHGVVYAVLEPRGLVEAGGVVVPAWWKPGAGPPPPPGSIVRRDYDLEGRQRWIAVPPESPAR
jgi:hypothetical protein